MEDAIGEYLEGKPKSYEIFAAVYQQVRALGPFEVSVGSQISFGAGRKFAWFWLYNVTQSNPNGILHTTLRIDERTDDPHIRAITQISKNRWNHQVIPTRTRRRRDKLLAVDAIPHGASTLVWSSSEGG